MLARLRKDKKNKGGFTLTEIAIVIGIIGLILGAVWAAASNVAAANKMRQLTSDTMEILANYRRLYASRGMEMSNFTDITCTGLAAGFFPADMKATGGGCTSVNGVQTGPHTVPTPWGGNTYMVVQAYQSPTVTPQTAPSGIIMEFWGLTGSQCDAIASTLMSPAIQWISIDDVNGAGQWINGVNAGATNSQTGPYTYAQITAACKTESTDNGGVSETYQPANNDVQIMYPLK